MATAKLKNPLTGQGRDDAITQYRTTRDGSSPLLRRAVVHFAVDAERVAMTTRLAGNETRFLPFNRGHGEGAGTFAPEDLVTLNVARDKLIADPKVQQSAAANPLDDFMKVTADAFQKALVQQMDVAENLAIAYLDHHIDQQVNAHFLPIIHRKAKVANQEHCAIGDLLGPDLESAHLEYKASLRTHQADGTLHKPLESASLKTIAAFLNSDDGGTLLIGVADDGRVHGLDNDYPTISKGDKDPRDRFLLHLSNIVAASMGDAAGAQVRATIHHVDGHDLCRVQVDASGFPVPATVTLQKGDGPKRKVTEFYVRTGNRTVALDDEEKTKHITRRWPPPSATAGA